MLDTIKNWLDIAIEFCKENTELLLIIGAGIIVLIIIIAFIKSLMGTNDEDDFDFDEIEFTQEARREEIEKAKEEILQENKDWYITNEPNKIDLSKVVMEEEPNNTLDDFLKELNKIGNNNLDQVQLKIKDAEFVVKYKDGKTEGIKEVKTAEVKKEPITEIHVEEPVKIIPKEEPYAEASSEVHEFNEVQEDELLMKKFSSDNLNVTRSGKVYTEEELKKQIRD